MPGWTKEEVEGRLTRLSKSWQNSALSTENWNRICDAKSRTALGYPHDWGCHLFIISCEQEFGIALPDVTPETQMKQLVGFILTRPTTNSPEPEEQDPPDEPICDLELVCAEEKI